MELLQYTFMQNALLASLLVGVLCGLVGTYVVARRLVFIAGGVAHASLGGVGLGALLGVSPLLGAAGVSLLTAFGVSGLSRRREVREDSAIALVWAVGMSVGVMCAYMSPTFLPDLPNYIFGNILLTTHTDILLLAMVTLAAALLFVLRLPQITALAFDREVALAMGVRVGVMEALLTALMALAVVAILRTMGIMLAICLLSVPQLTAALFARRLPQMAVLGIVFCLLSCLSGLALSYCLNVPSGATIVLVSVVIYALCMAIKGTVSRYFK